MNRKPFNRRTLLAGLGAGAGLALTAGRAAAQGAPAGQTSPAGQTYPTGVVRLVVPFSAGSMTDIVARAVAEKLSVKWRHQVIVENRPGLAGASSVARGPADGSQLMVTSNGHSVIGVVNKNAGFDPVRDFVAISRVATTPSILITAPTSPYATMKDFVAAARAQPGGLSYGSAGLGSSTGIAAELFRQQTGTQMVHVPHRGLPESQISVLRGDTAMAFTFFNVGGDLIQAGKLRGLAVTGDARMPQLPDVPTFAEAGLPEFRYDSWFGMLAAAGLPRPIVTQVSRDVAEALADPEMVRRFAAQGVTLTSSTPEAFEAELRGDADRYGRLLAAAAG